MAGLTELNYIILDTESTGAQRPSHGSALDPLNKLWMLGLEGWYPSIATYEIEACSQGYGPHVDLINDRLKDAHLLVLFNAKHDLHWLRRYGIKFDHLPIWDCQLAEFILGTQQEPYPSLDKSCERRGLSRKLDIVKTEYWEKGLDTDEVPLEILSEYLAQDLKSTHELFLAQVEELETRPGLKKIIWRSCQDLKVTQEMEWNGLKYDIEKSLKIAFDLETQTIEITNELTRLFDKPFLNWASPAHVSLALYGGKITVIEKTPIMKTYKNGKVKPSHSKVERPYSFPRLVEPLPNTGLSKEGQFSTDEKTLASLKCSGIAKQIVEKLLTLRKLEKKIGTYYRGIPKTYEKMNWENSIIHGQLNHCVARTGRLSSSKPNLQNIEEGVRTCLISRF